MADDGIEDRRNSGWGWEIGIRNNYSVGNQRNAMQCNAMHHRDFVLFSILRGKILVLSRCPGDPCFGGCEPD